MLRDVSLVKPRNAPRDVANGTRYVPPRRSRRNLADPIPSPNGAYPSAPRAHTLQHAPPPFVVTGVGSRPAPAPQTSQHHREHEPRPSPRVVIRLHPHVSSTPTEYTYRAARVVHASRAPGRGHRTVAGRDTARVQQKQQDREAWTRPVSPAYVLRRLARPRTQMLTLLGGRLPRDVGDGVGTRRDGGASWSRFRAHSSSSWPFRTSPARVERSLRKESIDVRIYDGRDELERTGRREPPPRRDSCEHEERACKKAPRRRCEPRSMRAKHPSLH